MSTRRESVEIDFAPHYNRLSDIGVLATRWGWQLQRGEAERCRAELTVERIEGISQMAVRSDGEENAARAAGVEPSPWESGSNVSAEGGGGNIKRAAAAAC